MTGLIVDNFAGGGGASTGIEAALGRPVDIAINHDPAAIAMHKVNHPGTRHYCESVWDIDPREVTQGQPVALCWFSPDCKHFSKAKGGKPVEKAIRGLAWVALRWAATVRPSVIILENVEEFKTWGPLLGNQPDPRQKGRTFNSFVNALRRHGYDVEYRELRACDFGAPTIRKRFFLIARCDGLPIVWPEPTHGDPRSAAVQAGIRAPWRTAADIIDWSIPCPSIFERARPLAEATQRRIVRGIWRYVIENPEPFIININHSGDGFRGQRTDMPLHTITAKNGWGIVAPNLIKYHGDKSATDVRGQTMTEPIKTVDTSNRYGLVAALLTKFQQNSIGHLPDEPIHTVMPGAVRFGLTVAHLAKHYGGNYTGPGAGLDEPTPTITTTDHNALVTSHIVKLRGTNTGHAVDEPLHTVTAGGNHLGEVRAFLLKYYGQGIGQECGDPLHTIKTHDTFGLVTIHGEPYQIADIGMRMLSPRELFAAQGFPDDYIIDRDIDGKPSSKAAQVARCGNAVPPPLAEALVRANLPGMCLTRAG